MSHICTGNPNQVWCYDEPVKYGSGHIEMTEADILECYSPYWKWRMKEMGKENLISDEACIDDWIIVNWAYKKDDSVSK